MATQSKMNAHVTSELIETIRSLPVFRETKHCDTPFTVSAFDFYARCPDCGARVKLRSLSALPEIEDVFDAVFEWMNNPAAQQLAIDRQQIIAEDDDDEE